RDGSLHPVQAAFVEARALQCGYCTPGMVLSAVALLRGGTAPPDDDAVRAALAGNICRCGGYPQILKAVRAAAADREPVAVGTEPHEADAGADAGGVRWTAVLEFAGGPTGWGWSTPGGARLTVDAD